MRIIGVNGSPRPLGATGRLVRAALGGAASKGAETLLLDLGAMKYSGCIECMRCKPEGVCAVHDDMKRFYEAVPGASGLVVGTPVYFDQVSGQMKLFLDRMFCYLDSQYGKRFPSGVKAVLAVTWEMADATCDHYDYVVTWLKGTLHGYYGIETVGVVKANRLPAGTSAIEQQPEVVERARALGEVLASEANREQDTEKG